MFEITVPFTTPDLDALDAVWRGEPATDPAQAAELLERLRPLLLRVRKAAELAIDTMADELFMTP
ncbi:MAG: hypothetical protein K2X87_19305 [Gemmataceae bacterium]|nr:hypothetical protein [Gemmataceae bacterium]